jgi:periplasmic protein
MILRSYLTLLFFTLLPHLALAFDRIQLARDARAHIGIVSDRRAEDGAPLIIHNIGRGTQEENILNEYSRITHYRYQP